jgi:hypothetical protein
MEIGFVTVLAGVSQRLIADSRFAIPGFCRMAFRASDAGMSSAQSEPRAGAVIESTALPGLRVMAGLTPRCPPLDELAEVRILMTGSARRRDAGIPHGIPLLVAFRTLHGAVFPLKRECGFAVIEKK